MRRNPGAAGDFGAGLARHQRIEAAGELAFRFARKAVIDPFGDQQAEDAVAQELQPFLVHRMGAALGQRDRKSVVLGKSVSVRVDLGGPRIIKKKTKIYTDMSHKQRESTTA